MHRIALVIAIFLFAASIAEAESRIPLKPEMLLNETAIGNPLGLVDEQELAGDPAAGKGGHPVKPFFPGWTGWQYPVHVMIDLGVRHQVTRLFLYNESSENPIVISWGRPFEWKTKPVTLGGYQNWVEVKLDAETRYLRLTLLRTTSVSEIVAYGTPLEKADTPAPKPQSRRPRLTVEQLVGVNAFIDDPVDSIAGASAIEREYHSWSWDFEGSDKQRRFQPSAAAGGNAWFFDDYYQALKAKGVIVAPAIQGNIPELFGGDGDAKPVAKDADPESPASYAAHAEHLFQFAARYGSRKVPDAQLILAKGQPRKSGLNLLKFIENWNEPDKNWRGRTGLFEPYELAAMCSADRDGDQGRMKGFVGVRTADPEMKLVMGGLAGLNIDVLRAMKLWADYHRKGDFPADVINLHHYCSDGNEQGFKTKGISPEDDHLREKMAELTAWRDANVPDREIWLTEFGYDTDPRSPLHSPAIGSLSAQQVQSAWLIRSVFALAAAGVDRATMFMLRDVSSHDGGVFATCGLVTEKGEWKPKTSWFAMATLKQRMTGYRFDRELPSGNPDIRLYRFERAAGAGHIYAVWCTTSEDKHVAKYPLAIPDKTAELVEFAEGKTNGVSTPLQAAGGRLLVNVSETPILVVTAK